MTARRRKKGRKDATNERSPIYVVHQATWPRHAVQTKSASALSATALLVVKPTVKPKARSVENKDERAPRETKEAELESPERQMEQLALEYNQEQPRRLLVVRGSARTARGSIPTPPIQL